MMSVSLPSVQPHPLGSPPQQGPLSLGRAPRTADEGHQHGGARGNVNVNIMPGMLTGEPEVMGGSLLGTVPQEAVARAAGYESEATKQGGLGVQTQGLVTTTVPTTGVTGGGGPTRKPRTDSRGRSPIISTVPTGDQSPPILQIGVNLPQHSQQQSSQPVEAPTTPPLHSPTPTSPTSNNANINSRPPAPPLTPPPRTSAPRTSASPPSSPYADFQTIPSFPQRPSAATAQSKFSPIIPSLFNTNIPAPSSNTTTTLNQTDRFSAAASPLTAGMIPPPPRTLASSPPTYAPPMIPLPPLPISKAGSQQTSTGSAQPVPVTIITHPASPTQTPALSPPPTPPPRRDSGGVPTGYLPSPPSSPGQPLSSPPPPQPQQQPTVDELGNPTPTAPARGRAKSRPPRLASASAAVPTSPILPAAGIGGEVLPGGVMSSSSPPPPLPPPSGPLPPPPSQPHQSTTTDPSSPRSTTPPTTSVSSTNPSITTTTTIPPFDPELDFSVQRLREQMRALRRNLATRVKESHEFR
ncbi:hypothetical protein HK102_010431, partial [Quaeritorhiza haematococci]